jgi:hypothetical protein
MFICSCNITGRVTANISYDPKIINGYNAVGRAIASVTFFFQGGGKKKIMDIDK